MHYSFENMAGNTILGSARQVVFFVEMGKLKWESSEMYSRNIVSIFWNIEHNFSHLSEMKISNQNGWRQ